MAKTIIGVYDDITEAGAAVDALKESGFPEERISVVTSKSEGSGPNIQTVERESSAGGSAAIGGAAGLAAGIAAIVVPGVGPLLAAGPIIAALVGAGVGAAVGGLLGALKDLGLPEEEAEDYSKQVRAGRVLVAVQTEDGEAPTAIEVMEKAGARDMEARQATSDKAALPFDASDLAPAERARRREARKVRAFTVTHMWRK